MMEAEVASEHWSFTLQCCGWSPKRILLH